MNGFMGEEADAMKGGGREEIEREAGDVGDGLRKGLRQRAGKACGGEVRQKKERKPRRMRMPGAMEFLQERGINSETVHGDRPKKENRTA